MSDTRYTSAALSRALRDAGLRQEGVEYAWCSAHPGLARHVGCGYFTCGCASKERWYRALRLGEVVEELEAVNPAYDWALGKHGAVYAASTWVADKAEEPIADMYSDSPVEAAGNLLLAVLREKNRNPSQ